MKVCVTSRGPGLDSTMDPRFGLSPYFIFVDPETLAFKAVQNPFVEENGEAVGHTALFLARRGIEVVITGPMGSYIYETLRAAGIKIYIGPKGKVEEVVKKFKHG